MPDFADMTLPELASYLYTMMQSYVATATTIAATPNPEWDQFEAWLAGAVNGGVNGDGRYPITNTATGVTTLVLCPAALMALAALLGPGSTAALAVLTVSGAVSIGAALSVGGDISTVGGLTAAGNGSFGGSLTAGGAAVLTATNYGAYAPSLIGAGASGTWGINISGTAAAVSSISSGQVTSALGYTPASLSSANNFSGQVSIIGAGNNLRLSYNQNGNDAYLYQGSGNGVNLSMGVSQNASGTGVLTTANATIFGFNTHGAFLQFASGTVGQQASSSYYLWSVDTVNGFGFGGSTHSGSAGSFNFNIDTSGNVSTVGGLTAAGNGSFGGSLTAGGAAVLTATNYGAYAPSLIGAGASGTWGINISGTAAAVSSISSGQVTSALGYTPASLSSANNFSGQVSIIGAGNNLRLSYNQNGNDAYLYQGSGNGVNLSMGVSQNASGTGVLTTANATIFGFNTHGAFLQFASGTVGQQASSSYYLWSVDTVNGFGFGGSTHSGSAGSFNFNIDTSGNVSTVGGLTAAGNGSFGGSLTAGGAAVLTATNYGAYAPSLIGAGASGTWGINISGTAAAVSSISSGQVTSALGYTPASLSSANNFSGQVSIIGAGNNLRLSYNQNGNDAYLYQGSGNGVNLSMGVSQNASGTGVLTTANATIFGFNTHGAFLQFASGTVGQQASSSYYLWSVDTVNGFGFGGSTHSGSAGSFNFNIDTSGNVSTVGGLTAAGNGSFGGSLTAGGAAVLTATNYGAYAPSLIGAGASGTWGINISGTAAAVSSISSGQVTSALGYTPASLSSANNFSGQVSIIGAGNNLRLSYNQNGNDAYLYQGSGNGVNLSMGVSQNASGTGVLTTANATIFGFNTHGAFLQFASGTVGQQASSSYYLWSVDTVNGFGFGGSTHSGSAGSFNFNIDTSGNVSTVGGLTAAGNGSFGGSLTAGGAAVLTATNYGAYAPSLIGAGASGTWGINISGTAAAVSSISSGQVTSALGYTPASLSSANNFSGQVSIIGAGNNLRLSYNQNGNDAYLYQGSGNGVNIGIGVNQNSSGTGVLTTAIGSIFGMNNTGLFYQNVSGTVGQAATTSTYLFVANTANFGYGGSPHTGGLGTFAFNIDPSGNVTQSGNLTFTAANPTISTGGSYLIIPNGLYISGTSVPLYSAALICARGGLNNDAGTLTISNAGGATTIGGGLTVSGATYFNNGAYFYGNQTTHMATSAGGLGGLGVTSANASSAAFMYFNVAGDFAAYLGIDPIDNQFRVGGWSMGAASYPLLHSGNYALYVTSLSALNVSGMIYANGGLTATSGYFSGLLNLGGSLTANAATFSTGITINNGYAFNGVNLNNSGFQLSIFNDSNGHIEMTSGVTLWIGQDRSFPINLGSAGGGVTSNNTTLAGYTNFTAQASIIGAGNNLRLSYNQNGNDAYLYQGSGNGVNIGIGVNQNSSGTGVLTTAIGSIFGMNNTGLYYQNVSGTVGQAATTSTYLFVANTANFGYGGSPHTGGLGTFAFNIDPSGNVTQSGNLTFTAANPTISTGGSYLIIPNGLYISGTSVPLYSAALICARGGLNNDTGTLTISNAGGATTIGGGLTVSGATYFNNGAYFYGNQTTHMATSAGGLGGLGVTSANASSAAFMYFNVAGDFAAYLGIDPIDNQFRVGGWSMGAASYPLLHSGNYALYVTSLSALNVSGMIYANGGLTATSGYFSGLLNLGGSLTANAATFSTGITINNGYAFNGVNLNNSGFQLSIFNDSNGHIEMTSGVTLWIGQDRSFPINLGSAGGGVTSNNTTLAGYTNFTAQASIIGAGNNIRLSYNQNGNDAYLYQGSGNGVNIGIGVNQNSSGTGVLTTAIGSIFGMNNTGLYYQNVSGTVGQAATTSTYLFVANTANFGYGGSPHTGGLGTFAFNIDPSGNVTQSGNLTFTAANPTISTGGSYLIIPNGLYISGTSVPLYSAALICARGGLTNDAGYLQFTTSLNNCTLLYDNNVYIGYNQSQSASLHFGAAGNTSIVNDGTNMVFYDQGVQGFYFNTSALQFNLNANFSGYISPASIVMNTHPIYLDGNSDVNHMIQSNSGVSFLSTTNGEQISTWSWCAFTTNINGTSNQLTMILDNVNQRVGIKNSAPAYALHVTGQIYASGSIISNGTTLTSDERRKVDMRPMNDNTALKILRDVQTHTYLRIGDHEDGQQPWEPAIGQSAQAWRRALAKYGVPHEHLVKTGHDGFFGIDPYGAMAVTSAAVRQVDRKTDVLARVARNHNSRIEELEAKVADQGSQIIDLKARLAKAA